MLGVLHGLLRRPALMLLAAWAALMPSLALAAGGPGEGQPFGIDWTPIVFWVIVGAVILGGFLFGFLIDWGNR